DGPEVVGPTLVPLLRHRIVRLHAGPAGSVDDGLPSGHRPYLLAGDELHTLLPAVPEGAELSILLLFDEELHDRAEFVLGEVAGVPNLLQVVLLEIDGGEDGAIDPGIFHRRLPLEFGIEDDRIGVDLPDFLGEVDHGVGVDDGGDAVEFHLVADVRDVSRTGSEGLVVCNFGLIPLVKLTTQGYFILCTVLLDSVYVMLLL